MSDAIEPSPAGRHGDELRLTGRSARRGEHERRLGGEHGRLPGHDPSDVGPQRLVVADRHAPGELGRRSDLREPVLPAEARIGVAAEQRASASWPALPPGRRAAASKARWWSHCWAVSAHPSNPCHFSSASLPVSSGVTELAVSSRTATARRRSRSSTTRMPRPGPLRIGASPR